MWGAVDLDGVTAIVEPTVGAGNFVQAAPHTALDREWYVFEIDAPYVARTTEIATAVGASRFNAQVRNAFDLSLGDFPTVDESSVVLVIGNPPWVTNSAQGSRKSTNLPPKTNRSGLRGLDALTGRSNFDIAEAILLQVLGALAHAKEIRIALLLKRSVALKVGQALMGSPGVHSIAFSSVDGPRWFDVAVDCGLFQMTWMPGIPIPQPPRMEIRPFLGARDFQLAGLVNGGRFVHDLSAYDEARHIEADTAGELRWRQGIKHDLASVLELRTVDGDLVNGLGELVDIEHDVLSPLYKSSDLANDRDSSRLFPLYQHDLKGPAPELAARWPKLHRYLNHHRLAFESRRSRIYRGKPPFMLFGVGPYTTAPFKVAVSGLYKKPRFALLTPSAWGTPPLVDDTCYLLPYGSLEEAAEALDYLSGRDVERFLGAIVDATAKRPYTADALRRIRAPGTLAPRSLSQASLL